MAWQFFQIGLWGHLGCFFFFSSIFFSDIILIRAALVLAYFSLIIGEFARSSVANGFFWNTSQGEFVFPAGDLMTWYFVCTFFHLFAVLRFISDEWPFSMGSEDGEKLWRLFWRRTGCPRIEFTRLLKEGSIMKFRKNEIIVEEKDLLKYIHIVIRGVVHHEAEDVLPDGTVCKDEFSSFSGDLFYLQACSAFGVNLGRIHQPFITRALSNEVTLIRWEVSKVASLIGIFGPSIATFMSRYIQYCSSHALVRTQASFYLRRIQFDSREEEEDANWFEGGETNDMLPLRESEPAKSSGWNRHIMWILESINLFPPRGIRHIRPPFTCDLAVRAVEQETRDDELLLGKRGNAISLSQHFVSIIVPEPSEGSIPDENLHFQRKLHRAVQSVISSPSPSVSMSSRHHRRNTSKINPVVGFSHGIASERNSLRGSVVYRTLTECSDVEFAKLPVGCITDDEDHPTISIVHVGEKEHHQKESETRTRNSELHRYSVQLEEGKSTQSMSLLPNLVEGKTLHKALS